MTDSSMKNARLRDRFSSAIASKQKKSQPQSIRLSFRVTPDEKQQLLQASGTFALSSYIRHQLLGDAAHMPRRKKQRSPDVNAVEIARILGMLGQSELARSMLALSLAAQSGDLAVDNEVSDQLRAACDDIGDMKNMLIIALGVKPLGGDGG